MACKRASALALVVILVAACSFDPGGVSGSGSNGTLGDDSGTSDPGTASATGSPSTGASASATGDSGTDPSVSTSADSTVSTTAETSASAEGGSSTDPGESSAASASASAEGSTTDPSGGESTGVGSTGPTDPSPYGNCADCPDGSYCSQLYSQGAGANIAEVCLPPCDAVADCPQPSSGNPTLSCPSPNFPYCSVGCNATTCPDGMQCYGTNYGDLCFWPY